MRRWRLTVAPLDGSVTRVFLAYAKIEADARDLLRHHLIFEQRPGTSHLESIEADLAKVELDGGWDNALGLH